MSVTWTGIVPRYDGIACGRDRWESDSVRCHPGCPRNKLVRRWMPPQARTVKPTMKLNALLIALWLVAGCAGPIPSGSDTPDVSIDPVEWPRCSSPVGFSVAYAPGWFVHPADPSLDLDECSLFASQRFTAERDQDGGWVGAQIVLTTGTGCRGSFEVVVTERELKIQGFPAWARGLAFGEGPDAGTVSGYEYFINLRPQVACENGSWFVARTEPDAPGNHEENMRTLDDMMASLKFSDPE